MAIQLEPQDCVDPKCDGEITWDESGKDYVCMTCDRSATQRDLFLEEEDPTPWCHQCGAMKPDECDCLPIAANN